MCLKIANFFLWTTDRNPVTPNMNVTQPTQINSSVHQSVSPSDLFLLFCGKSLRPDKFGEIFFEKRKLTRIASQVFSKWIRCDGGKSPRPHRFGEIFFE